MSRNTKTFMQSLNRTRAGLKLLLVTACILALIAIMGACAIEPYDPVTVLKLSGRVTNTSSQPLRATLTLFNAPGLFSDYQRVGGSATNVAGEYSITASVDHCVALNLDVSANGYHHATTIFTENDIECTTKLQVRDFSLSPVAVTP